MAGRGLSVITHKAAASLPNRQTEGLLGVKVRLSSGESRFRTEGSQAFVYNVPKKLRGESAANERYFLGVCVVCFLLSSAIAEIADCPFHEISHFKTFISVSVTKKSVENSFIFH